MIPFDSYKYSQNGSIYLRGVNQFSSGEFVAQSEAVYDEGRLQVSGSGGELPDFGGNVVVCTSFHVRVQYLPEIYLQLFIPYSNFCC